MINKPTLSYALLQGSEWAIDACLYCYSSVFLLSCGLSNTMIGLILSIAVAVSSFIQIILGEWLNHCGRTSLRKFFFAGGLYLICSSAILFFSPPRFLSIGLFILDCLLLQLLPAFMNSAAMYEIKNGTAIAYGIGRGTGSIGYAIATAIIGQMIAMNGISSMFAGSILLSMVFLFAVRLFFMTCSPASMNSIHPHSEKAAPFLSFASHHSEKQRSIQGGFLLKYPRFSIVLIGVIFTMTGHTLMSNFIYQILSSQGGTEKSVGLASAIAAFCEVPVMFLFDKVSRRLRFDYWFKISCALMMIKMSCTFLANSLPLLLMTEILQASYALFAVSSVYYVGRIIPQEDTISSQAYLNAASTIGVLCSLLSGGWIIDHFGIKTVLLYGSIMLIIGTSIVCFYASPREFQSTL